MCAAELLASLDLPEPWVALVSSAERTRETWSVIGSRFPDALVHVERLLYEASPSAALRLIEATVTLEPSPLQCGTLIVVGHNPTMHELALLLVGSNLTSESEMAHRFPTSAFAVIRFTAWTTLTAGAGSLVTFEVPRATDAHGRD